MAIPDGDGGFSLRGKKFWVYNAVLADTLIVFARTVKKDANTDLRTPALTAFLVPANEPGLTIHQPVPKIGARGIPVSQVCHICL